MTRGVVLGLLAVAASFWLGDSIRSEPRAAVQAAAMPPGPLKLSFDAPHGARHPIPAIDNLPEPSRAVAHYAIETTRAPCEPCWSSDRSIAACLELSVCPNLHPLLQRARRGALAGMDTRALTAAVSYGDIWVPAAAGAPHGPLQVELWIDPRDAFSAQAISLAQAIDALPDELVVTIHLFRSESTTTRHRSTTMDEVILPQPTPDLLIEPDRGARTRAAAELRGVRSSPTWFIGGYRLRGMVSRDQLALVLHREIEDRALAP